MIVPYGDAGVLVSPALEGSLVERARSLAALAGSLRERLPGADVVQGGSSLLVLGATGAAIAAAAAVPPERRPDAAAHHDICVIYDGPDLAAIAERAGIRSQDVARLHAERTYTALVTGFLPGFAYLGEVDLRIAAPRLATPRKRVAPGAVGIAGSLTGVYPFASPGGWNWIARAIEPSLFDPSRDPPRRIGVLDTVRFVPVEPEAVAVPPKPAEATTPGSAPALEVGRCAPVATVQDRGRCGLRGHGIPWSGASDRETLDAANAAVGNDPDAAALEIPLASFEATALRDLVVSADGEPARRVAAGETIVVSSNERAVRYLAVRGGIDVPVMLGGRSTLAVAALGGHAGRSLRRGDRLAVGTEPEGRIEASATAAPFSRVDAPLTIVPAPPDPRLGAAALDRLVTGAFTISEATDRLGTRLGGARIPRTGDDRALPEPVLPGAIQVTTDGSVIVLGPDAATTGGYPVVAVLTPASRWALARLRPGSPVRLHLSK